MKENQLVEESITRLGELEQDLKIDGIPSGVEGLDKMFFVFKKTKKGVKKEYLNGIPRYSIFNITGVPDTGKSLLVEQVAIAQAGRDIPTIFVTVETPALFVGTVLKQKAIVMGIDEKKIEENIIFIDAASHHQLREEIPLFLNTLAYAIKKYHVKFTIIDSITGFFEAKEMIARTIVRQLFHFMKKWYQTALFVSQKRSGHEDLSAEAAGGYAIAHILDGSMVLSKKVISSTYDERLYNLPIGEMIRLFRIDGCRLCGHDTETHVLEIEKGLIKIGASLKELKNKQIK